MEREESTSLDIKNEQKHILSLIAKLERIDSMGPPLVSNCYIYKVPPKLRTVKVKAYTPSVISIGPVHHKKENLKPMEGLKLWCLNKFLTRAQAIISTRTTHENLLENYFRQVGEWEAEIRCCYSETIPMKRDDFVSMILIDACFIIEYFLLCTDQSQEEPWCRKIWPACDINLDLILLENQLPFFVLERLFNLTFSSYVTSRLSFLWVAFKFLADKFLHDIIPDEETHENLAFPHFERQLSNGSVQVQHLCDMLRILYLPCYQTPRELGFVKLLYSANQLYEAGIKFQVDRKKSITELQYSNGKLTIPLLQVSDWTEPLIRNVVAFEQCHLPNMSYVTDYIILMDCLINIEKDVEVLVEKEIMNNLLGDNNAVVSMVNNLCKNVVETKPYGHYTSLSEELNNFYKNRCHMYKAIFIREYWSTPWKKISIIAASVLLLLILIQIICSISPYFSRSTALV